MKQLILILIIMGSLQSCKQQSKVETVTEKLMVMDSTKVLEKNPYKGFVFDSKKDLVCGMPTSAGVSDTSHYKGKVYGFCSKECKDEFVKNPAAFLVTK